MKKLKILLNEVQDRFIRENFKNILTFLRENNQMYGFRHVEIEFTRAHTEVDYAHGLNYLPKDVIVTSKIGAGEITWHYDQFTKDNLVISTTGACTVRAYVGSHREEV